MPLPAEFIYFFLGVAAIAIVSRLIAGGFDLARIERFGRGQGWTILERRWAPFGPGWAGSPYQRLYDVTYRTGEGEIRRAFMRTSALAGVWQASHRVVEPPPDLSRAPTDPPPQGDEASRLRRENEVLRRRIADLESRPEN